MAQIPPAGGFPLGDLPADSELGAPALFLADAIDPRTGDYLSIQRGVDPVEAVAVAALQIRRDSGSAVRGIGSKLHEIEFVDDRLEFLVRSEVEFAWRRLIDTQQIRLDQLTIAAAGDGAEVRIHFTNLVSGKAGTLPLPLLTLLPRAAA